MCASVVFYSRLEMPFPLYTYIDTIFADEFSWDKFRKVNAGMSKDEVKAVLGKPLREATYSPYECWDYSTDGKVYPYADFSWYSVKVCFDDEFVESKFVNEFRD